MGGMDATSLGFMPDEAGRSRNMLAMVSDDRYRIDRLFLTTFHGQTAIHRAREMARKVAGVN